MEANPIVQLCVDGSVAEFRKDVGAARRLYARAWRLASSDFERCVAAHYMARMQSGARDRRHWNRTALLCAHSASDNRVQEFFPSLYLNMGASCRDFGEIESAEEFFRRARELDSRYVPSKGRDGIADSAALHHGAIAARGPAS